MASFPSGEELDRRALKSQLRALGLNLYVEYCRQGLAFISEARDKRSFPINLCQNSGACLHQKSCLHVRDWAESEIRTFFRVNGKATHPEVVEIKPKGNGASCHLEEKILKTMALVSRDIDRDPKDLCKNGKTCLVEPCKMSEIAKTIPLVKNESDWD